MSTTEIKMPFVKFESGANYEILLSGLYDTSISMKYDDIDIWTSDGTVIKSYCTSKRNFVKMRDTKSKNVLYDEINNSILYIKGNIEWVFFVSCSNPDNFIILFAKKQHPTELELFKIEKILNLNGEDDEQTIMTRIALLRNIIKPEMFIPME